MRFLPMNYAKILFSRPIPAAIRGVFPNRSPRGLAGRSRAAGNGGR
jgi:hypothetical protein